MAENKDYFELSEALRKGQRRHEEWKCVWHKPGWHTETTDIISRVMGDERGNLSGTLKLVRGPGDCIAEVSFPPGEKPSIVAYYGLQKKT